MSTKKKGFVRKVLRDQYWNTTYNDYGSCRIEIKSTHKYPQIRLRIKLIYLNLSKNYRNKSQL